MTRGRRLDSCSRSAAFNTVDTHPDPIYDSFNFIQTMNPYGFDKGVFYSKKTN